MLPWHLGEYKPKTSNINFEAQKKVLLAAEEPMIENKRSERINSLIACKWCLDYADLLENNGISFYGFKHNKTEKIDNYILIGVSRIKFMNKINYLFSGLINS